MVEVSKVYTFGPFRLEAEERRLVRDGQLIPLAGKTFDLLELLVSGVGALQKQQALMDALWPDVMVEQNNLQSTSRSCAGPWATRMEYKSNRFAGRAID